MGGTYSRLVELDRTLRQDLVKARRISNLELTVPLIQLALQEVDDRLSKEKEALRIGPQIQAEPEPRIEVPIPITWDEDGDDAA